MATILNWAAPIFFDPNAVPRRTLSSVDAALVPITLAQAGRQQSDFPDLFFEYGLYFQVTPILDSSGLPTGKFEFILDSNGQTVPFDYVPYQTDSSADLADDLIAIGYPSLPNGTYINALELATLELGAGNDSFSLAGEGITQSLTSVVDKFQSQGYIFQSNIDAGAGDDYVGALMPWFSVFNGGDSTPYTVQSVVDAGFTVEQIPFGDTIELKGSRFDWDVEFKDGDGDGQVTLQSVLAGLDFIAVSNSNRITAFERIRWGDALFDLVVPELQDNGAVYGQPDYFLLGGEEVAPELNSSIQDGSGLWRSFQFSRTKLTGIAGTATTPVQVFTGAGIDTPYLVGGQGAAALRFAELYTQDADDIVWIQDVDQSLIELGIGADFLEVAADFVFSTVRGGLDGDNIILTRAGNSDIFADEGNDVVELRESSVAVLFDGGTQDADGVDTIFLPGSLAEYSFSYVDAPVDSDIVFFDGSSNRYVNFESYRFADASLSLAQLKAQAQLIVEGVVPEAPRVDLIGEQSVASGTLADYGLYLASPFAAGASIELSLNSIGLSAEVGIDFLQLLPADLVASPGLSLAPAVVNPVTKGISFSVSNVSGADLRQGSQLLTFSVETLSPSLLQQPDKTFAVQLNTPNNLPNLSSLITTIVDGNAPAPRLDIVGPNAVDSGLFADYALYLADGLADGGVIQIDLNAVGVTAEKGVDFVPLSASDLFASPGITLSEVVTNPVTGELSLFAFNESGLALPARSQLLNFTLRTLRASSLASQKTVSIELGTPGNAVDPTVFSTAIVTPAPLPDPRIDLIGPLSVESGNVSTYALYLADTFAADGSVDIALNAIGGTAELGVDFEALLGSDLTASPGLALSPVVTNPVTGELSLSIGNTSGGDLQAGDQLLTFTLQTLRSSFEESQKTVNLQLSAASNAINPTVFTTSIITPPPLIDVGGSGDGGLVLPDLPARPEIPAPPSELADDADQDLSLPDGGQLITKGPVRDGVQILVGTAFKDVLVGGLGPDFLDGGASSDTYTGGPEQDVFRRLYGDPDPDVITDFAAGGDRVQIGAVPLLSSLGRRLNGRTQWKKALAQTSGLKAGKSSKAFFVHQRSSGRIYFNANRTDRGWGREGGLVVTIPAGEPFSWKDLQFDYGTASSADSLASLL